jgi:hypothetical protein
MTCATCGRQLDAHELAPPAITFRCREVIEHPETAAIVGHDRLHAHEVIACRPRRGFRVAPEFHPVGVGFQRAVATDFHHRDRLSSVQRGKLTNRRPSAEAAPVA